MSINRMKTIIMAGGKGTRIASIAKDIPKPMIKICGKPILEHQIECLKQNNLTDITICIGHLGNYIKEYFGDGHKFGVTIDYFEEKEPLGTAGCLYKMDNLPDDFLLLCGDTIFDIDFNRFIEFHRLHNAEASLISHPNGHPYDSSLLITEIMSPTTKAGNPIDTHKVIQWLNKEDTRVWYKNRVNAGIEIISKKLLAKAKKNITKDKVDLDRDILKPLVSEGNIFAYDTPEYIKDMGTPDRYYSVENDIKNGLVKQRNLSHKQKAIFLDRDGTINRYAKFLTNLDDLELLPTAAEAIRKINESGYLAIIVTNQPVISRGDITFSELQEINNKLETLLGKEGAYIDALYFCPHHTDKGFKGELPDYKMNCSCRKPNPGMIIQACDDFNIDAKESYMIGDSKIDIECGNNANCKNSILISEEYTLLDAINDIL